MPVALFGSGGGGEGGEFGGLEAGDRGGHGDRVFGGTTRGVRKLVFVKSEVFVGVVVVVVVVRRAEVGDLQLGRTFFKPHACAEAWCNNELFSLAHNHHNLNSVILIKLIFHIALFFIPLVVPISKRLKN